MSKDLLKRAEKVAEVFAEWLDMDSMTKESAATVGLLIQELSDNIKAYTERLESKELMSDIEDYAGKYLTKEEKGLQLKTFYKIAQAAINVIKGDDNANG